MGARLATLILLGALAACSSTPKTAPLVWSGGDPKHLAADEFQLPPGGGRPRCPAGQRLQRPPLWRHQRHGRGDRQGQSPGRPDRHRARSGFRHLHERQGLAPAVTSGRRAPGLGHNRAVSSESPLAAARAVLRRTFGHADFRGLQAEVIGEVLAGRSAMAVLPTGGGKSRLLPDPGADAAGPRPGGLAADRPDERPGGGAAAVRRRRRPARFQHRPDRARRRPGGGSRRASWTCSTCRPRA